MKNKNFLRGLVGLLIGAANGLFGGGGGMVAVPLLTNSLGYPQKQAHATAISVIAPICLISAVTYIVNGYARLSVIIPAALGNVIGGLLGASLLGKLSVRWVNIIFTVVMAVAGVKMLLG